MKETRGQRSDNREWYKKQTWDDLAVKTRGLERWLRTVAWKNGDGLNEVETSMIDDVDTAARKR